MLLIPRSARVLAKHTDPVGTIKLSHFWGSLHDRKIFQASVPISSLRQEFQELCGTHNLNFLVIPKPEKRCVTAHDVVCVRCYRCLEEFVIVRIAANPASKL